MLRWYILSEAEFLSYETRLKVFVASKRSKVST